MKRKSHQKGEKFMVLCWWPPLPSVRSTKRSDCKILIFIIAIKFITSKNMSFFTPGRLYYSCKLLVKERGGTLICKAFNKQERP